MEPERARRAHAILTAALDAPQTERDAIVAAGCVGDAALEARVRKLLAAADRSAGFLESPALASHAAAKATVPDSVENYLVVGVLGTGGMATVYEAVQQNPSRRVALKVMHQSLTSTDAFLRFRLETETLARLRHPGIAQIYEAGTAQLGLPAPSPFFAMELVPDAMAITDHARTKGLSLRDRLAMFVAVCDAVVYGHQNGVIHRDIKPGNVLVGADGQPKVIDFGIARTTPTGPGDNAGLTTHSSGGSLLGTLNSMSPEQCASPNAVDARSDVYSLGVLLYELVTGQLPFDLSKVSIPQAVRIITEETAPDAGRLCPEARGDLSAIIAKALEKDRDRRYDGAAALAADVRRWLAFLPIEARPATVLDSAWKFARRNPHLAAAISVAVLALAIGTVVATSFAVAATRARDQALVRERELEAVTLLQESLLRGVNVSEMGDLLRESLLARVTQAATNAAPPGDAEREAELTRREFSRLIEPVNFTSIAVSVLHESVLARYARSIDSQFADQPLLRARLLQQLADTMNTLGLYGDAEPIIREALELRRTALDDNHPDTLQSLLSLGSLLSTLGRNDEAIAILKEAHARRTSVFGADHQLTLRVGTSLGGAYRRQGDLEQAQRIWSETLQTQRRVLGDDHADTLRTLNNLGVVLAIQGKPEQAEACWRELLERRRRALGEDHPDYRSAMGNLGVLLQDQGKLDEAKSLQEQSLAADRRKSGDAHVSTLVSMAQLASLLRQMGDLPGAESLLRECYAGRTATLGPEHPDTLRALSLLGSLLAERGNAAEAIDCLERALESQRRVLGDSHADTIESTHRLRVVSEAASPPADTSADPPE
jgi:tetratricopeptide (TPR) repeat protein